MKSFADLKDAITAKMILGKAKNVSTSEIKRTLGPCIAGNKLIKLTIEAVKSGEFVNTDIKY